MKRKVLMIPKPGKPVKGARSGRKDSAKVRVRIGFSSLHQNLEDLVRRYVVSSLISEYNGVFSTVYSARQKDERKDIRSTPDDCFATIQTETENQVRLQVANLSCGGMCVLFNTSDLPAEGEHIQITLPFLDTAGKIEGKVLGIVF